MTNGWKRGLPPGPYYDGMVDDYEVAFAPLAKWHRKRTPEEKAAWIELKRRNKEAACRTNPD